MSSETNQTPIEAELVERNELVSLPEDVRWLTDNERAALDVFRKNFQRGGLETFALSPRIAVDFFALFLQGQTLKQIAELNPQYGMGPIVHSAVEGRWDIKYKEYLEELYYRSKGRAVQTAAEGIGFIADLLAVTNIKEGDKLRRFIQTHNPKDLEGVAFKIESLKGYKDAVEILMKLTGQDKVKDIRITERKESLPEQQAEAQPPKEEKVQIPGTLDELVRIKRNAVR